MSGLNLALALALVGLALALRPWRALGRWRSQGPPWPCLALWASLPLLWCTDRLSHAPLAQPFSAVPLLVLMAGWPLAMLALVPAAALALWLGALTPAEALQRAVWLGAVPGSLALLLGLATRRWLPRQPFTFILLRAFVGTWIALALAGAAALWLAPAAERPPVDLDGLLLARFLAASAEAVLTGMLCAIFVAYRPQWLATWSDRLYLH